MRTRTMKICLLTTMQPSTNPRLVKEADALASEGYEITVVYAHCAEWATLLDKALIESRSWSAIRVGGHPKNHPARHHFTRVRHRCGRAALGSVFADIVPPSWALNRTTPELIQAAEAIKAD